MRQRAARRLLAILVSLVLETLPARAGQQGLVLEGRVNGRPTGVIAEVQQRDGALLVRGSDLRAMGLDVPGDEAFVPLGLAGGVQATVNALAQTLDIETDPGRLRPTRLSGSFNAPLPPVTPADWGLLLNYDTLGTFTGIDHYGAAQHEARMLGPLGTFATTGVSRFGNVNQGQDFVRLDSNWTWSEPDSMRAWRLGDVVSGAVGWSRAIRMGGGQIATDFNMRPDLIRFGTPSFNGVAALPSTVDVLVGGVRQFSSSVPVGPFELRSLPVVASGGSEVVVSVRDALGRQTLTTLPFYSSTQLLAEGVSAYSAETGQVRLGYGLRNTDYVSWVGSGSGRYGLSDWLTVEGHGEATDGLALLGAGGTARLGGYGIASLALAGSGGRGATMPREITDRYGAVGKATTGPAQGGQVAAGLQSGNTRLNTNIVTSFASAGYRDAAALFGTSTVRSSIRTSVNLLTEGLGTVTLAWIEQRGGAGVYNQVGGTRLIGGTSSSSLLNLSYSLGLMNNVFVYASGFYDLRGNVGSGVFAGLTFTFGDRDTGNLGYNRQDKSNTYSGQIQRSAVKPGDLGWRVVDQEGDISRRLAEVQYLSGIGRVTGGIDQSGRDVAGRAGVSGSVVLGGGSAFLADRVYDSFAIVRADHLPRVPVLYENRPVAETRWDGRALVPQLRSFDANRLSIDSTGLPADIEVDRSVSVVRPGDRSGVVVDFGVRRSLGALVRFALADGRPVPIGSVVQREGQPPAPVGRDGRAYLTGLGPRNAVRIEIASDGTCEARFDFTPAAGDIPLIGPVRCE